MEDFYVSDFELKVNNGNLKAAIEDMEKLIRNFQIDTYRFLCTFRAIIKESSHGSLILNGDFSSLKYSWVSKDYQLIPFLWKKFGFSEKYVERVTRVISKFLVAKKQDDVVLGHTYQAVYYNLSILDYLSISKMIELLPLSIDQIKTAFDENLLTKFSTCADIRAYVKSLKSGSSKAEKVLEEPQSAEDKVSKDIINKNGLYVKMDDNCIDYLKKVVDGKKYKNADEYINKLISYAINNNIQP